MKLTRRSSEQLDSGGFVMAYQVSKFKAQKINAQ